MQSTTTNVSAIGRGEFSLTVWELAYALRIEVKNATRAAGTNSPYTELQGATLDRTLTHLMEFFGFVSKGWDLSRLDEFHGPWVQSLRSLYSLQVAYPASLPPSQGIQIRDLILREAPKRVLEIGCFVGISSHWIASGLQNMGRGTLDSVDTFLPKPPNRFHFSYLSDPLAIAVSAVKQAELNSVVTFHCSESVAYERALPSSHYFGFIFIDGDHSYEGVLRDFLAYFPRLNVGGVILLHDTNPKYCGWTGPRRLIDEMLAKTSHVSVEEIETQPNFGMAVIRKLSDVPIPFTPSQMLGIKPRLIRYAITSALRDSKIGKAFTRQILKPVIVSLRRHHTQKEH